MSALQNQEPHFSVPATTAGLCLNIPWGPPTAQDLNIYTDLVSEPDSGRETFPRTRGYVPFQGCKRQAS